MKQHELLNPNSNKVLNLKLQGKTLISETGKIEKTKINEKEFSSLEDALKFFMKKEWEALKKGFVLRNQNPQLGEPYLHYFIGGGYTGALAFQATPKGVFIYKNDDNKDFLIQLNDHGDILNEVELPKELAWNIEYREPTDSLLLDIDHYIYEYEIESGTFRKLKGGGRGWTSFVSVGKNRTVYATGLNIFIVDNQNNIINTQKYSTKTINGSTPFCGKLSNDGKLLAFHNKVGEIQIIDAANGTLLSKIEGDFQFILQMEFAENNNLLIAKEMYGTNGMRYFELSTNKEIQMKTLEVPEYTKDINVFCLDYTQSRLVLVQRDVAYVFDFSERKLLHSFKIDHIVKSCEIKFIGQKLGVRTDYGCFSLYNV